MTRSVTDLQLHIEELLDQYAGEWTPAMLASDLATLLAENKNARRAVGWLVAASGGSIVVPPNIMRQDFDITAEDTIDGGRRFLSARALGVAGGHEADRG